MPTPERNPLGVKPDGIELFVISQDNDWAKVTVSRIAYSQLVNTPPEVLETLVFKSPDEQEVLHPKDVLGVYDTRLIYKYRQ